MHRKDFLVPPVYLIPMSDSCSAIIFVASIHSFDITPMCLSMNHVSEPLNFYQTKETITRGCRAVFPIKRDTLPEKTTYLNSRTLLTQQ